MGIVDASYLKLRELRLAYNMPSSVARLIGFSQATIALVGRNLLLWAKQPTIDRRRRSIPATRQASKTGRCPPRAAPASPCSFGRDPPGERKTRNGPQNRGLPPAAA